MLSRKHSASRGFTLLELLVVVACVTLLATLAYPSYASHIRKAKRTDALVQLMLLQQAEERWRSVHPAYGSLAEVAAPAAAGSASYRFMVDGVDAAGYVAVAQGLSLSDTDSCRYLRMTVAEGNATYASGPTAAAGNGSIENGKCWMQ